MNHRLQIEPLPPTRVVAEPAPTLEHPLVYAACSVDIPSGRPQPLAPGSSSDPDRLVLLSCWVSFMVLPFVL